ncbi:MAG: hypothetical protein EA379_09545 [Phycisphaerales bacterium]|nr:MAG: hypothetical protein EA379_09545 [Phycisphaerales bacterium]
MSTIVVTPASTLPLSLEDAKRHARIDHAEEDLLVSQLIAAATEHAETVQRRKLLPTVLQRRLHYGFPDKCIELLYPPLITLTSVVYTDPDGADVTLDPDQYRVMASDQETVLTPARGAWWPTTIGEPNDVRITYTAGYADAASVPRNTMHALRLLVAHWYEHREAVVVGTITANVPMTVDALLAANRVYSLAGGSR